MSKDHHAPNSDAVTGPDHQFDEIAFLYDELMAGVPYRGWVEYLHRVLQQYKCQPKTVLDLCCGTGTVSLILARMGYEVSGVDISSGMIDYARRKAEGQGLSVTFDVQDAARLRLGKRFALVISLFDSLNYILDASDLQNAFYRASEHLDPGALFIFDMNTELALSGRFFDQSNYGSGAPVIYDWRSTYDEDARLCTVYMNFIYRRAGAERRAKIVHYQRAYDIPEVIRMLESAGLSTLAVYDGYTLKKASARSDRVFFVARK
jgi:ubiquinone/menaquinone biosynthesis C-methylase UbiE